MKIQKRYWDSCCFLGYLKGEADKKDACEGVLNEAKKGNILIVTSALTLTEVTKLKHHAPIPEEDALRVRDAFKQEYIRVRNVDTFIADLAREMVWRYRLDPKDSIHVATAMKHNIPFFDTFDQKLIQLAASTEGFGMKIGIPCVASLVQEP